MAFVFISHIPLMPHNESAVSKKKKKKQLFFTQTTAKARIPTHPKLRTKLNNESCWISRCSGSFASCFFHRLVITPNFVFIFFTEVT